MEKVANKSVSGIFSMFARILRYQEYAGVSDEAWEKLANSKGARQNHAEFMKQGCPKLSSEGVVTWESPAQLNGVGLARAVLGENYVSPTQLELALDFKYSEAQLIHLANTFPDLSTILWLYKNKYVLVPGSKFSLNLEALKELFPSYFDKKELKKSIKTEGPYQDDIVFLGDWLMVRRGTTPDSVLKSWDRQDKAIKSPEFVPNVAQLCYALFVVHKVNGADMPPGLSVRTASTDSFGNHLSVAAIGPKTIALYFDNNSEEFEDLGVASARI